MEVGSQFGEELEDLKGGLKVNQMKVEMMSPAKAQVDLLVEVERLVAAHAEAEGRALAVVRRCREEAEGEQAEFLQITDKAAEAGSYFSPLVLVVAVGGEGVVLRLLATRHRRQVREVAVAAGGAGQLGGALAACLAEVTAGRYAECRGAWGEEDFQGDLALLDPRLLVVEGVEGGGAVYRARACQGLLAREGSGVCEACSLLRVQHGASLEQEEEEEEEDSMGMLSQYLEVSMEDEQEQEQEQPQVMPEVAMVEAKPRSHLGILRTGLDSNPATALKPKLSYKKLISMAIKDSHFKMLKLTDIYAWILARYPGFNSNRTGFQNSVRHNLSLNKVFIKVNLPGVANNGKGNYWTINPKFEDASNSVPDGPSRHRAALQDARQLASRFAGLAPGLHITPCSPAAPAPEEKEEEGDSKALVQEAVRQRMAQDMEVISRQQIGQLEVIRHSMKQEAVRKNLELASQQARQLVRQNLEALSRQSLGAALQGVEGGRQAEEGRQLKVAWEGMDGRQASPATPKARQPALVAHDFSDGLVLDKPNFSYKELIMIAIFCEPSLQVCLNDIYLTIKHWFPYYQQRSVGLTWQNSVRHNLSLNKCFRRLAPHLPQGLGPHRTEVRTPSSKVRPGWWRWGQHCLGLGTLCTPLCCLYHVLSFCVS